MWLVHTYYVWIIGIIFHNGWDVILPIDIFQRGRSTTNQVMWDLKPPRWSLILGEGPWRNWKPRSFWRSLGTWINIGNHWKSLETLTHFFLFFEIFGAIKKEVTTIFGSSLCLILGGWTVPRPSWCYPACVAGFAFRRREFSLMRWVVHRTLFRRASPPLPFNPCWEMTIGVRWHTAWARVIAPSQSRTLCRAVAACVGTPGRLKVRQHNVCRMKGTSSHCSLFVSLLLVCFPIFSKVYHGSKLHTPKNGWRNTTWVVNYQRVTIYNIHIYPYNIHILTIY